MIHLSLLIEIQYVISNFFFCELPPLYIKHVLLTHVWLGPSDGRCSEVFFDDGCYVEVCEMDVTYRTHGSHYLQVTQHVFKKHIYSFSIV